MLCFNIDILQLSPLDIIALNSSPILSNMASVPDVNTNAPMCVLVILKSDFFLIIGGKSVINAANRMRRGRRPDKSKSLPLHPLGSGRFVCCIGLWL